MTSSTSGFIFGLIAAWVLWKGLSDMFSRPAFQRVNYRGAPVATSAGLVVTAAVFFAAALIALIEAMGLGRYWPGLAPLVSTSLLAAGFGMLGLLDDLAVDEGSSGYRGHVKALMKGRLTAGSLKMLAGPAVAIVVVQPTADGSVLKLLLHGAIVALAANLANLFDRAPGRVTKVSTLALGVLTVATAVPYLSHGPRLLPGLAGAFTMLGAAWGLLRAELNEELMLGDAGANPLGAAIGLAVVFTQSLGVRIGVLVLLLIMNLISERVSFTKVIRSVPPLRMLDDLGRPRFE
ncbi:MAG: hypothetical protein KDB26_06375 [Microthrixaceae bacterium]|nr:hypothetical protein [Microthrixaceae bacterium]